MKKQPKSTPPPDWHPAARKIGESVRFSFLSCIKREMDCNLQDAEAIFKSSVERGDIVLVGMAGILRDVPKYKLDKRF